MSLIEDANGNDMSSDSVFLVKRALVGGGWVCAPKHMTQLEVQLAVNKQDTVQPYLPDGTMWIVLSRKHEDEELESPGHCGEHTDHRQHWFVAGGLTGFTLAFIDLGSGDCFLMEDQEADARDYIENLTQGELTGKYSDISVQ